MTGPRPYYFFFSYARRDWYDAKNRPNPYLRGFFEDLAREVADLAPCDDDEATFRDQDSIRLGDNWEEELAQALQVSRTMVAVYSTRYFRRPACGKEFQVFLDRRRLAQAAAGGGERILPVLWISKEWLEDRDLPPPTVRHVQYTHGDLPPTYFERGMKLLSGNRRTVGYRTFLNSFAKEIIRRAEQTPLPPLPYLPRFEEVQNAFEGSASAAGSGPSSVRFVTMLSGRPGATTTDDWRPFPGGNETVDGVLEGLVDEGFNYSLEGPEALTAQTDRVTDGNSIWVVLSDPEAVGVDPLRTTLSSLLGDANRDISVVIPMGDAGEPGAEDLARRLEPGDDPDLRVLPIEGPASRFIQLLVSHLQQRRQRIVESMEVHSPARGDGSVGLPFIRGPGEAV